MKNCCSNFYCALSFLDKNWVQFPLNIATRGFFRGPTLLLVGLGTPWFRIRSFLPAPRFFLSRSLSSSLFTFRFYSFLLCCFDACLLHFFFLCVALVQAVSLPRESKKEGQTPLSLTLRHLLTTQNLSSFITTLF